MLSEQEKQRRLALLQLQNQMKVQSQQSQQRPTPFQQPQQLKLGTTNVSVQSPFQQQAQRIFTLPSQQVTPRPQQPLGVPLQKPVQAPVITAPAPAPVIKAPTITTPKLGAPQAPPRTTAQLPFYQQTYQKQVAPVLPSFERKAPVGFDPMLQETLNKKAADLSVQTQRFKAGQIGKSEFDRAVKGYGTELSNIQNLQSSVNVTKKSLPTLINEYNQLDDAGQRDIRKKLSDVFTNYNSSRTPELRQIADTASTYLSTLTTPKEQLKKDLSPEAQAIIDTLPEVKPKQSFAGTAKDILGALYTSPVELGGRVKNLLVPTPIINELSQNEANLAAGKISQEEFDRRQSQINTRIAQVTGTLTGQDKGLLDRTLRVLGTVGEVGTYLLPGAGIVRGVAAPAGKLTGVVAQQAALGGITSGLSAFGRTGIDTQPTDVAAATILGAVAQGVVPISSAVVNRTVNRIKAKPFNELADSEKALLARENTFHPQDPNAPKAGVPEQIAPPTVEVPQVPRAEAGVPAPVPSTSVPIIPDQALNKIITDKNIADIENAVKAVYPNGEKNLLQTAIDEINKTQNPTEVRTILDSLAETKATIEGATPSALPTQAAAREQALIAETQQPTGAIAAPEAPQAPRVTTAIPEGVQGAQASTAVPGATEIKNLRKQISNLSSVSDINTTVYRGQNEVNIGKANPDRPVYYAETPDYAATYGTVVSKPITGKVLTVEGIHGYEQITQQLKKVLASYLPVEEWKKIPAIERSNIESWVNHTLYGERLSTQFNKPMPEVVKKAFNDLGIDYIKIPGDQFRGTVGQIGHQTEIIEIPKPKLVEQPSVVDAQRVAPTAVPEGVQAPQAPRAAAAIPEGVQGAQAPTAVPGAARPQGVTEAAIAEAQKATTEAERYKVGRLRNIITKVKKTITPDFLAVESDRLLEKAARSVGQKLKSADRLELALTQSRLARNIGIQYIAEGKIGEIIAKYSKTPEQLRDFNFYRSLKRDVEQMQDGRGPIFRNYTIEQKQQFINEYERRNPQAESDLRQLSQAIQSVQDLTTKGKNAFVSKADIIAARTKKDGTQYQYWTPLQRVTAEDLARVEINAYNLGTLGRQRILQDFAVNDLPVNLTFEPLTDYVETAFRQLGQSKVIKMVEERARKGQIAGARLFYTGEQIQKLKGAKAQLTDARKIIKGLTKDVKISQKQYKTLAREMAAIKGEAYKEVARKLKLGVKGKLVPEAGPSVENINALINDLFKTDMAKLNRLNKKYMNREPKLSQLLDNVMQAKRDLEIAKAMKKEIKSTIVDITPDPTTGKQTILGIDTNGNQFRIELPPEWARLLQGLDRAQLDDGFKLARAIQEPFRQAWVGILNPPFQISTAIWNAVWAPVVAREGYRLYGKSAVAAGLKSLVKDSDFQKILNANGAISFGGDLRMLTSDSVADAIGSQASDLNKFKWYTELQNARGFRRSWKAMNEWGGKIDQATRMAAATAAYNKGVKQGLTKEQAIAEAVMSWNNVLPDFSNVSQAVKTVDAVIPFTAPSVAGTRTTLRAFKDRPFQTIGKLGVLTTAIGSIYGYNLASEQGQAFYKDMKESKKEYVLDNNLIIVLPGATKNKKTGEWSGIIKIPLAPEARPINSALRSAFLEEDLGAKTGKIAISFTDFLTGKLRDASSPAMQVYSGMVTGKDPRTGREIWDQTMDNNEKATAITKYLKANLGLPGAMTSGNAWDTFVKGFVDRVYGAKGATEAGMYYINQDNAIKKTGLDRDELNAYFSFVSPPKRDLSGNIIKDKTYYDAPSKALAYLRYPKTFEVDKSIDAANRAEGKPGDPLFDLNPEQRQVVLNIQRLKDTQDAKALGVLNKSWLDGYYQKRSEYFDKILSEEAKKAGGVDPMGITIPVADKTTQDKIAQGSALTGADKAKFYADNPEVTDYFQNLEEYNRTKRKFQGLPLLDQYPEANPEVKSMMDEYNALPKGDGPLKRDGTPSSPTRSAWIKSNPDKWAQLTDQWNKQNIYNLQREAGLAVFEGIDMSQKNQDRVTSQYGSTGRFGGAPSQNYYNTPIIQRQYLNQLVSDITPFKLPEAPKLKAVPKIKTKKPSIPRRTMKIKLQ